MLDDAAATAAKKKKQPETAAEKQQRLATTKLQVMLNKHKDQLKKDILKKRALLDKTLHNEIQVNIPRQAKNRTCPNQCMVLDLVYFPRLRPVLCSY